ncbi:MAG: hypothetical protein A3A80_02645 [Candidatus Terrybacteria bacterium RIFCSPLOWO2_01_FULL_44_24]|uniref:Mechanosensitive ion channel protein MscS n=1 Tax=Candidatus Terrybacteria bacterium RIFCSPHIGHO2_01_FULL_43_35 TaxID=1802361 RepID=A0A1G2PEG5_9BACT|nr:MAG: hypothetical protein A2828_02440 [Candidatus Terrybacteria bacterium RIFCSPHIGHO2_01_FULL_43_35]OHA50276.1 MAG: hypothetical protein A3B75_00555 [Candidatus Terrybacteria bacterium RIFCSPHIGHO2_02_FULL_43_14]OHA50971.1 MAG: hypothetical protein A3A80_02645 [Candidatus Terrybacteria bacterium RIFCSPLOWO2_01_FULL_44_24]
MSTNFFDYPTIVSWIKSEGPVIIATIISLFLGYKFTVVVFSRLVHVITKTMSEGTRQKTETIFTHIFVNLSRVGFFILTAIYLLSKAGIDIGPIAAGLGIGGLALGFAAQILVRDIISGMVLLGENRFKKGDKISLPGLVEGIVEDFDLRGVTLKSEAGERHFVPFGEIRTITKIKN